MSLIVFTSFFFCGFLVCISCYVWISPFGLQNSLISLRNASCQVLIFENYMQLSSYFRGPPLLFSVLAWHELYIIPNLNQLRLDL